MPDPWEPRPVEPFPDRSSELVTAMQALAEAARRGCEAMRQMQINLFLLTNEDLVDWNDEMDNCCYPNIEWPDPE